MPKQQNSRFRHEWKHEINYCDLLILRQRLTAIARLDPHAVDGILGISAAVLLFGLAFALIFKRRK